MRFGRFEFGSMEIDGVTYEHDVVIDRGKIRKRKKKASKPFRGSHGGHTPLTTAEDIPWNCRRLVIGTGAHGALPVLHTIMDEAEVRHIALVVAPTAKAIEELIKDNKKTNAILHVTC